jgi:RND family efflux transporter MFP subunit
MKRSALISLLLLGACAKAGDDAEVKPTASVTTAVVVRGAADEIVAGYGAAEFASDAERTLTAPVEASLVRMLAPAGSRVTVGQAVAELRPTASSSLDLDKAAAESLAADAALGRARRLRAAGLAGDGEVEAAATTARTAGALAKSLSARSSNGLILRAPATGIVESMVLEAGATAAQGAPVAKIGALAGLRVRLGVESARAATIRAGQAVRLTPLAGGETVSGVVMSVDPRLDPQTRQAGVFVRVPAGALAPGEAVKGEVMLSRRAAAVLAPRASLVFDGDQPAVFTVSGGTAHRRPVTLGVESGDLVEIASGLSGGERIVTEGAAALEDGMAVRADGGK